MSDFSSTRPKCWVSDFVVSQTKDFRQRVNRMSNVAADVKETIEHLKSMLIPVFLDHERTNSHPNLVREDTRCYWLADALKIPVVRQYVFLYLNAIVEMLMSGDANRTKWADNLTADLIAQGADEIDAENLVNLLDRFGCAYIEDGQKLGIMMIKHMRDGHPDITDSAVINPAIGGKPGVMDALHARLEAEFEACNGNESK